MVGERLIDKIALFFSIVALGAVTGCAGVQKSTRLNLGQEGLDCEVVSAEGQAEVMRCGGLDYTLQRRAPDEYEPEAIISMYERREKGKTHRVRTEWYRNSRCPVSMDIDLGNMNIYHIEFDEYCKAWGIKKVKEVPDFEGWTYSIVACVATNNKLPEDVVYRMLKAIFANSNKIKAGWKAFPSDVRDNFGNWCNYRKDFMPAHAGAVKFYKEQGIDVPNYLIPPEYNK